MREGSASTAAGLSSAAMWGVLSFCLYVFLSATMVFANKAVFAIYKFEAANVLLLFQMLMTVVVLRIAREFSLVKFPLLEAGAARRVFPVTALYILHAALALVSLQGLNITAYSVVKRLTPVVVLLLEIPIRGNVVKQRTWAAVVLMVTGTLLAAGSDVDSSPASYLLGFASCLLQASYLIYVSKTGGETSLCPTGLLYYHSCLSIPLLLPLIAITGEWEVVRAFPRWNSPGFHAVVLGMNLMGLLLNYSIFLCTACNSPLTTTIGGHVKSILPTILGFFAFGGVTPTPGFVTGILLNVAGGSLYGWIKLQEQANKQKDRERDRDSDRGTHKDDAPSSEDRQELLPLHSNTSPA